MDIRSVEQTPVDILHQGTVQQWWLFKPRELRQETLGGYLEHVDEFVIQGGGQGHPHHHHTWEFYFILSGRGTITIDNESREIGPGDLITVPPDAIHSLRPNSPNASLHCFAFAVGLKDTPEIDYMAD